VGVCPKVLRALVVGFPVSFRFGPNNGGNGGTPAEEPPCAGRNLADGVPVPLPARRNGLIPHDLTAGDQRPQQFSPPGPATVTLGAIAVRRAGCNDFGRRPPLVV